MTISLPPCSHMSCTAKHIWFFLAKSSPVGSHPIPVALTILVFGEICMFFFKCVIGKSPMVDEFPPVWLIKKYQLPLFCRSNPLSCPLKSFWSNPISRFYQVHVLNRQIAAGRHFLTRGLKIPPFTSMIFPASHLWWHRSVTIMPPQKSLFVDQIR